MRKFLDILTGVFVSLLIVNNALAAGTTVLPKPSADPNASAEEQEYYNGESMEAYCIYKYGAMLKDSSSEEEALQWTGNGKFSREELDNILSCAIATGYVHLWMIPYFLVYWTESLLALAGIIGVLMFLIGGIFYIIGGVSETITKEKGKTTMKWALMGMALSFLAWMIVNVVLYFVSQ